LPPAPCVVLWPGDDELLQPPMSTKAANAKRLEAHLNLMGVSPCCVCLRSGGRWAIRCFETDAEQVRQANRGELSHFKLIQIPSRAYSRQYERPHDDIFTWVRLRAARTLGPPRWSFQW